jgi:hypothetical protein
MAAIRPPGLASIDALTEGAPRPGWPSYGPLPGKKRFAPSIAAAPGGDINPLRDGGRLSRASSRSDSRLKLDSLEVGRHDDFEQLAIVGIVKHLVLDVLGAVAKRPPPSLYARRAPRIAS